MSEQPQHEIAGSVFAKVVSNICLTLQIALKGGGGYYQRHQLGHRMLVIDDFQYMR